MTCAGMCAQVLLAHGRLRLDQVAAAVAARLERQEGEVRGDLHARFISLVNGRHIERVPPADMPMRKPVAFTKAQVQLPAPALITASPGIGLLVITDGNEQLCVKMLALLS